MMRYYSDGFGYGYGDGMMGGGLICSLIAIILLIDLILFGILLWKKIKKEDKSHNN